MASPKYKSKIVSAGLNPIGFWEILFNFSTRRNTSKFSWFEFQLFRTCYDFTSLSMIQWLIYQERWTRGVPRWLFFKTLFVWIYIILHTSHPFAHRLQCNNNVIVYQTHLFEGKKNIYIYHTRLTYHHLQVIQSWSNVDCNRPGDLLYNMFSTVAIASINEIYIHRYDGDWKLKGSKRFTVNTIEDSYKPIVWAITP